MHLTSKLVRARTKHEPVGAPLEALISPLHHHGCSVVLRGLGQEKPFAKWGLQEALCFFIQQAAQRAPPKKTTGLPPAGPIAFF
jgi:hypothetical protein